MSFSSLLPLLTKQKDAIDLFGRVPNQVAEIVQDFCQNTYGVSPCTAAGSAGTECFNTFKTCQDRVNYAKGQKVVRFVKTMQDTPKTWGAIPQIKDIQITPPRINAGGKSASSQALGTRGTVVIELQDGPSSDLQLDPYVATRPYDPMERGTFWTKWIARNPYFINRPLRLRLGYLGQDIEDMSLRYYVINRIEGPDSNGRVKIHGFDVLRLVDDQKAQAPAASPGKLNADVTNVATSLTVTGAVLADYQAAPGTIRIQKEVMTYTSLTESLGVLTFSGLTRGTDGTLADAHTTDDSVQRCLRYTDESPVAVLVDLFSTWGKVNTGALNVAGWTAEANIWLVGYELTTLITEPTGVAKLIAEICEQLQIMIWVDEKVGQVQMMALRPPLIAPKILEESSNIVKGSAEFKIDPEQRVSQVWLYFKQHNPTLKLDDENNYLEWRIRADLPAEGPNEHDESKVDKIHSRWLKTGSLVNDIQQRILARYRDNPVVGSITVDAKDRDIWTGQLIRIRSKQLTDETGAIATRQFQVTGANEIKPGHHIKLDLQSYDFLAYKQARYMGDSAPDYGAASEAELLTGAWYADNDGLLPDMSDGYSYQ